MNTTFAYRDDSDGARIRHAELLERHQAASRALGDADRARGRRVARIAAGLAGIAGAALMTGATIHTFDARHETGALTRYLLGSWPAMGLAYVAFRVDLWSRLRSLLAPGPASGDLRAEIARLEQPVPVDEARLRARVVERLSVALPLIAVALLAPLTLHAATYVPFGDKARSFDKWIGLSLMIVGHAHLVLAFLSWRFAKRVSEMESGDILRSVHEHSVRAWGFTILASAIPGALLLLIPPILTAITGLLFIPLAFWLMARSVRRERALIEGEAVAA